MLMLSSNNNHYSCSNKIHCFPNNLTYNFVNLIKAAPFLKGSCFI